MKWRKDFSERQTMKNKMITTHAALMRSEEPFAKILIELDELHSKKASDYGKDEDPMQNLRASVQLGIHPWIGCLLRMNDKMFRLAKFAKSGKLANESAIDSLNDIAVYAIMARILLEEKA
jgi:hypothetical protein